MPDYLPDILIKEILKTKKNIVDITNFCQKHNIFCDNNKEYLCKYVLHFSGYNTKRYVMPLYSSYCKILHELLDKRKSLGSNAEEKSRFYLAFTENMFITCIGKNKCSDNLKHFLAYNDIIIPDHREIIDLKKIVSSLKNFPISDFKKILSSSLRNTSTMSF